MKQPTHKTWFILSLMALVQAFGLWRCPAPPIERPAAAAASQAEVNAGTNHTKFVAPDTLAGYVAGNAVVGGFVGANNITDPVAATDLKIFANELQSAGVWSNLVDAVFFNPRFGPPTNSLYGRAVSTSNVTYDAWGAVFNGTSQVTVDGLPNLTSNCIVGVWRGFPTNSGSFSNGVPFGLFNTNRDGEWFNTTYSPGDYFMCQSNGVQSSGANDSLIYPGNGSRYDYIHTELNWENRKVQVISSEGNGIYRFWQNGVPMKVNIAGPFLVSTQSVVVPALNEIRVGNGMTNNMGGKFVGEVAAVLVFNCAMNTNMAYAVNRACAALEPETTYRIFAGDSLWMQAVLAGQGKDNWDTNSVPILFQTSQKHANESLWINISESGLTYQEPLTIDASNAIFAANAAPHGKNMTVELWVDYGINDLYALANSGATIYQHATNLARIATQNGMKFYILTTAPLWTNATAPYAYSGATETERTNFNSLVVTNLDKFSGVVRRDLVIGQNELNTNNLFSSDGLHLYGTNGWVTQKRLVWSMLQLSPNPTNPPVN